MALARKRDPVAIRKGRAMAVVVFFADLIGRYSKRSA